MYLDLVVIAILIIVVAFLYGKFSSFVYLIGAIDIFLRIMTYLKNNLQIDEITSLISKYLPESIPNVIGKYTSGSFYSIIMWAYIIIMSIFLFYTIKRVMGKK